MVSILAMYPSREFLAGPNDANRRLDRVLRLFLKGFPLSAIYSELRKGGIKVNGKRAEPAYRLIEGDSISIRESLFAGGVVPYPSGAQSHREADKGQGRDPLSPLIILKSGDLLFLNKPRGLPTHGPDSLDLIVKASGLWDATTSLSFVPAPLHRLDRNTSGLVTFSLSTRGAQEFTALLRRRGLAKSYLALVSGELEEESYWEDRLERDEEDMKSGVSEEGLLARTRASPLLTTKAASLVFVSIETGRTHQIRAQCASHGHPLVGDHKYGGEGGEAYFLHAWLLDFLEPVFPDLPRRIEAPIPPEALKRLSRLFGDSALSPALASRSQPT